MKKNFHELKHEWTLLSDDEVQLIHNNEPAIIVSPGYIHIGDGDGHYHYCALGVLPDCLRAGGRTDFSKIRGPHYKLTLRDLIKYQGFYPSFYGNNPLMFYQGNSGDYSVDFTKLIDWCFLGGLTVEQLKDRTTSSAFFTELLK